MSDYDFLLPLRKASAIAHHNENPKNWWGRSGNAHQRRKRRRAATIRRKLYLEKLGK